MPIFDFSGPDGKTYSIQGPDGATPEQAFSMLQQHIGMPQQSMGAKLASAVTDIPGEIASAAKGAAQTISDKFNPNSDANLARAEALKNSSFLGGMGQIAQGIPDMGRALLALPQLAASPVTGTARSVIGNTYDALAPQFTPEQTAQMKASGVTLPSGKDVADTAMLAMRPASASPAGTISTPAPTPSIADLKQAYKDVVNDPAVKSVAIPPQDVSNLSASTQNDLVQSGFRPTQKSAPDTFAELQRLVPGQGVQSVNIDDLLAARRALGATSVERDQFGKPTPDSVAAKQAMGSLDNLIQSYVPQMADANANYRAAMGADRLDYANAKAERRAAKSGAGMNMENTMRQEADKVPTQGLTPDQQDDLNSIVLGTGTRNALRTVGKLGVDGGLSLALHSGMAIGTHGATVPVTAAATLARKIGEMLTRGQMSRLSNSIRASSPLAQSLPPVPVSGPNPLMGSIPAAQIPQLNALLLRQMLGVMPGSADQQQ